MKAVYFVYILMALNACAAGFYAYEGEGFKSLYWTAAFMLNLCVVNFK